MSSKIKHSVVSGLTLAVLLTATAVAGSELVAIDAGHSYSRPGSTSATGVSEFHFNAALAETVSHFLTSKGHPVIPIGLDGGMDKLKERTATANQAQASFFLSIHHDSVQQQYLKDWKWQGKVHPYSDYASGFSLFVSRKNPELATSLQCATAIGAALKAQGLHPSAHHAEAIAGENREWANQEQGVYFFDDLIVLKTANMPAVLLEAGVIVNRVEEQTVQTPEMRTTIAAAIETGLKQCGIIH